MSTLQDRMYAKEWLMLAISKNKLANFVIGIPPYAKQTPNDAGIRTPVLAPNLEVLYDYYEENKARRFDVDVENAVLQIMADEGDDPYVILHGLMFVVTQLAYEKRGAAKFSLDCPKLLDAIKKKVNKKKFTDQNAGGDLWDTIVFYDDLLRKQYGLHFL